MASNDEYQRRDFFKYENPIYRDIIEILDSHGKEVIIKQPISIGRTCSYIEIDCGLDLPIVEESYQKHLRLRQSNPNYGVKINNPYNA